jgi:choline-sulfatase
MDRRDFLAGAAVTTLSAAVRATAQPEHLQNAQPEVRKGRRPNVLLLMSDQHKRSCMGAAGDPVAVTPNLDAFARATVRFTNVYCANPVCGPSRASILTGLFNHHLGKPRGPDYIYASGYKTMPERFSRAGYFSGLIGKMHFGDAQLHGFDYELEFNDWFQYLGPKAKLYADEMGAPGSGGGLPQIASLWDKRDPWKGHREPDGRLGPVAVGRPSLMDEEDHFESFVADETVRFLETYAGGDEPFFLVSSFLKPHNPFMPAKRFAEMFPPEEMKLSPTWGKADLDSIPRHVRNEIESDHYTPELREATEAQKRTAYYYGNLAQMDDCAGKILGALKRLGLDENTIVVYLSDHGEMLGDLGLWGKFQFYEGSCGVPFMVRLPGGAPAKCDVPLSLVSLSATLAELCDVPVDGPSDGKSFASLVRDPKSNFEYGPVFAEFSIGNNNAKYMIRDGQWKYTYWVDDVPELYDLSSDTKELRNVAGRPECAAKVKELHEKLMAWHTPPPAKATRGPQATREEGLAEQVWEQFLSDKV